MRDLFLKDLGWKLLSLFLAVGIWLTVHKILTGAPLPVQTGSADAPATAATTITYNNQPVEVVSAFADVRLYRSAPAQVQITLIGPADRMADLKASQIHAIVDLTDTNLDVDAGRDVVVSPPPGITLMKLEPAQVIVLPPPKP